LNCNGKGRNHGKRSSLYADCILDFGRIFDCLFVKTEGEKPFAGVGMLYIF